MARVTVTANDSWTVSIPAGATWVHSDKASGDGNGEINITVDVNPRADVRTATVTVSTKGGVSKTIAISQDSAESTLSLTPSALAFNADGTAKAA
jgi:hypothetical protein